MSLLILFAIVGGALALTIKKQRAKRPSNPARIDKLGWLFIGALCILGIGFVHTIGSAIHREAETPLQRQIEDAEAADDKALRKMHGQEEDAARDRREIHW